MLRPATPSDLEAVIELARGEEIAWFGAAESSGDEIADHLRDFGGVDRGWVEDADGRIRAFVLVSGSGEAVVLLEAAAPPFAAAEALLRAGEARRTEVQGRDTRRLDWIRSLGWVHVRSAFDLAWAGAAGAAAATWPVGARPEVFHPGGDDLAVHRLVYVDAGFGEVPGHGERPLGSWVSMVRSLRLRGWVARRRTAPVGWVAGRLLDDGRGWVQQLAVARAERGHGIGRALLQHCLADLLGAGAQGVGLNVQADNASAIGLYRSVGFEVEREWLIYEAPAAKGVST